MFRPSKNNLYVVPDVHGANDLLQKILDKILPLQINDQLIFLGDYIDRHPDGHLVLDTLIDLKEKLKQVVCLKGNHEDLLLQVLNKNRSLQDQKSSFEFWKRIGGRETIRGYLQRKNLNESVDSFPQFKLDLIVPIFHTDFIESLPVYFETENYIFVHGDCDPFEPLEKQDPNILMWGRNLLNIAQRLANKALPHPWKKTVVCGHSFTENKKPVILDKFMMLDVGSPEQLICMELNSREILEVK